MDTPQPAASSAEYVTLLAALFAGPLVARWALMAAYRARVRAHMRRAAGAHVVLMDLRGLSPAHRGCADELVMLARRGALGRLVALVDRSTDRAALAGVLRATGAGEGALGRVLDAEQADSEAIVRALLGVALDGSVGEGADGALGGPALGHDGSGRRAAHRRGLPLPEAS